MPDRESTIGSFVRARRRANDLTQRTLAELAGVGTRVVSEIERGKPTLRMDVVNAVLAVFGKRLGVEDAPRELGAADVVDAEAPDAEAPDEAVGA